MVADNGSTDGSQTIAREAGARVVTIPRKGYGAAYLGGIPAAQGKFIVIGDSDDTYDFTDLERFITPLRQGYDFVIGNRLKGKIEKGAMPWLNRYIGNPFLSGFLNLLFKTGVGDAHCGMRSFTRQAFFRMQLRTMGMEFASEMVVKASQAGLKIKEIPSTLHRSKFSRTPHLRPIPDGWRHLRFMLIYSPTHLFIFPGIFLLTIGFILLLALLGGPLKIGTHAFDYHFMVLGSLLSILGFQVINLGIYAKAYSIYEKLIPEDSFLKGFYRWFTLEKGIYGGLLLVGIGMTIMFYLLAKYIWGHLVFELRLAIFSMTLIVLGVQIIFSSFLLSLMTTSPKPDIVDFQPEE